MKEATLAVGVPSPEDSRDSWEEHVARQRASHWPPPENENDPYERNRRLVESYMPSVASVRKSPIVDCLIEFLMESSVCDSRTRKTVFASLKRLSDHSESGWWKCKIALVNSPKDVPITFEDNRVFPGYCERRTPAQMVNSTEAFDAIVLFNTSDIQPTGISNLEQIWSSTPMVKIVDKMPLKLGRVRADICHMLRRTGIEKPVRDKDHRNTEIYTLNRHSLRPNEFTFAFSIFTWSLIEGRNGLWEEDTASLPAGKNASLQIGRFEMRGKREDAGPTPNPGSHITLTLREVLAITDDWGKTNRRRGQLIRRDVAEQISEAEEVELLWLERLADARIELLELKHPSQPDELELIVKRLKLDEMRPE